MQACVRRSAPPRTGVRVREPRRPPTFVVLEPLSQCSRMSGETAA